MLLCQCYTDNECWNDTAQVWTKTTSRATLLAYLSSSRSVLQSTVLCIDLLNYLGSLYSSQTELNDASRTAGRNADC